MTKNKDVMLLGIFALVLGLVSGVVIWLVLALMHAGLALVWQVLPARLSFGETLAYPLLVCMGAGVLIGILQCRYGALPKTMEQVVATVKRDGGYTVASLPVLVVMILLPIIFGGAIGPEAGLTGLIAALWTLIVNNINLRGLELATMAEAGMAATLGVIFGAPLFGIVGALEPDDTSEHYRDKLLAKRTRIVFYVLSVVGAFASLHTLRSFFGGGSSLPRFARHHAVGWSQWKWVVVLILLGIIAAMIYRGLDTLAEKLAGCLGTHKIAAAVSAGALVGLCAHFLPQVLFSGETGLHALLVDWRGYTAAALAVIAFVKIALTTLCVHLGWRGGEIFPIIYIGATVGYAFTVAIDTNGANAMLDGSFAVAIVTAAMYAAHTKKPLTVVCVLLLCFPLTYILPITVAAFVAAKLCTLWSTRRHTIAPRH